MKFDDDEQDEWGLKAPKLLTHSCGAYMLVGITSKGEDDIEFETYGICPNCDARVLLVIGQWDDPRMNGSTDIN